MAYRDAGAPHEAELRRLEEEVRQLASQITPAYFRRLDPRLAAWRQVVDGPPRGAPERLADLTALADDLRQAIAHAPALEAALRALPRRVPEGVLGPRPPRRATELRAAEWMDAPYARARRLEAKVARIVGRHDPSAVVRAWRGHVRVASFEAHGAPMALHASTSWVGTAVTIATGVARGASNVDVTPLAWHHPIAVALRIQTDTRFGEEAFDRRFLVEGKEGARLLSRAIRDDLLALSRFAPPTLVVRDGGAFVRFRYPFSEELVEQGFRLVAAIRHAPLPLSLLRASPSW